LIERRRLLVAESAQLRHQLAAEIANLSSATVWVERGYATVRTLRSVWPWLAAGAGFFVARKKTGWLGTAGKLWSVWRVARKAASLWRKPD
jgi:hypothetical protein